MFWSEYLSDELFRKYRKHFPDHKTIDGDFVTTLYCSSGNGGSCFSYLPVLSMIDWLVDIPTIKEAVNNAIETIAYELKDAKAVKSNVTAFIKKNEKEMKSIEKRKSYHDKKEDKRQRSSSRPEKSISIPQGPIIKEGWLSKHGATSNMWQRRWIVLKQGCLFHLKDSKVGLFQAV